MGGGQSTGAGEPQGGAAQPPAKTGFGYDAQAISNKPVPKNEVKLAVSPLGGVPGIAQAWHSSVIVNGDEYSFSDGGITCARGTASHDAMAQQAANAQTQTQIQTQVFDMGLSPYTGSQLQAALSRYFQQGTYDLLKKNCNSFSDAALFYLLKKRIDSKYRQLETIGAKTPSLVSTLSGQGYKPNPKVQDFDLEKVIKESDPEKVWDMPGEATGGVVADSREAMRAARLARLGGGGGGGSASGSGANPGTSGG
eukprot:TRINITY_DN24837_c0_g1_i2.p1 TRINITY_DN24837_c0_g1~~TRINITY_DN24837_c0_g1_i2.p1  ORF type:complete len:253 (+),score=46.77 TRINITY_DN24837_c0_g1_i2:63-821(+)